MSEYKLGLAIVRLSEAATWELAKREWGLIDIDLSDEEHTCLCGHYPIKELCTIQNRVNNKAAVVGNCCVKKFLRLPSDRIFSAVKRVREDVEKSFNAETIDLAFERDWITKWDHDFYLDIMRKRALSEKQSIFKRKINGKILARVRKS